MNTQRQIIDRVINDPTVLIGKQASGLRRSFTCAVLKTIDDYVLRTRLDKLQKLDGDLFRLLTHPRASEMRVELVDLNEYVSFVVDALATKQLNRSYRKWLDRYRDGILDCSAQS